MEGEVSRRIGRCCPIHHLVIPISNRSRAAYYSPHNTSGRERAVKLPPSVETF